MQTEGASGVEVQLSFGFWATVRPLPYAAYCFRAVWDGHFEFPSGAAVTVTVIFKLIFERLFGAATHRRRPRDFKLWRPA